MEGEFPRGAEESAEEETQVSNLLQAWVDWTFCCYYCFDVFVVAEVALLRPLLVLTSWFSRKRGSCHLVHGVHGYNVCSVSDRVMCSVLAICRCIAPCARLSLIHI